MQASLKGDWRTALRATKELISLLKLSAPPQLVSIEELDYTISQLEAQIAQRDLEEAGRVYRP